MAHAKAEPPAITVLVCKQCKQEVSGPNPVSVAETMARHKKKAHGTFGLRKTT